MAKDNDVGSRLMKAVEAIALSPDDARSIIKNYKEQVKCHDETLSNQQVTNEVLKKIERKYKRMAATLGGATSLTGIIPGIGTAVSMGVGGLADVSASMKIQIDMTMCMALAINDKITNEDAKYMSTVIALTGSVEGLGKKVFSEGVSKATTTVIKNNLKGATLQMIKELFKIIGINFTKKSLIKAIPFGVGVAVGSGMNYALTSFVAKAAKETLLVELKSK